MRAREKAAPRRVESKMVREMGGMKKGGRGERERERSNRSGGVGDAGYPTQQYRVEIERGTEVGGFKL